MSDQNTPGNSDAPGQGWGTPDNRPSGGATPFDETSRGSYPPGAYDQGRAGHDRQDAPSYSDQQYGQQQYGNQYPHEHGSAYDQGAAYGAPAGGHGHGPLPQGMAIAALVFGILALVLSWLPLIGLLGVLLALIAIVLGIVALRRVRRRVGGGKGLAIAGLVTGILALILGAVISGLTIFGLSMAMQDGNVQSAVQCAQKPTQAEQQACLNELQQRAETDSTP